MTHKDINPRTKTIHCGQDRDPFTGASSMPIYQGSTFAQPDPDHPGVYDYGRSGNPTREALESAIAELEGGVRGFAFASGMAAITASLLLLKPGDHVIAAEDIYGGSYRILTTLFKQWGLETSFIDMTRPDLVEAAVRPQTRALFVETPSNPLLKITDLEAMGLIARKHQLLTIIDNTFPTPWLQRPIERGFDIVLHSATKFLGGHSDCVAGLAVTRTDDLARRIKGIQNITGSVLGPQDSWLILRGIRTLAVRMDAQQRSAQAVAEALSSWPGINKVFYPGLAAHPGRELNERQSSGAGAVLSFELKDGFVARQVLSRVKLCLPAVSLGGVESILSYPAKMSHAAMPPEERKLRGITDGLLRLSVGLEDPKDLLEDLLQALHK
ncbi:MAG: PLP-dependent transferase [Candidatus Omnitrophica bacterium]|nr:PLP-dependent transferase [Candidatus Omnitrophota bacterium]